MAAWPTGTAPFKVLMNGYDETMEDNRYSFQPTVGPPIRRRKGSVRTDTINGIILWTTTQLDAAITFYTDTLEDGVLTFTGPHPRTGSTVTMQFEEPLKWQPRENKLAVAVSLRILS